MAFSWQEQIKPAGTQDIQCDIEYLDKSYIHVYLDGVETTGYTWTSSTNIRLNVALEADTTVLLIRKTEREYLYIEFASGAPFIEGNVDTQNMQLLHLAQELVEGRAIPGFYGDIDMHGYRITKVGTPTESADAANKAYVDDGISRTLRVTDSAIDAFPSAASRAWKSVGFNGSGAPVVQDPAGTGLWGYVPVSGSFESGGVITQRFEVLFWESTREYWRWDGGLPKTVPPGSTPDTVGGLGVGAWIDVTDATLRTNLAAEDGLRLVGQCPGIAELRTIEPIESGQMIYLQCAVAGWAATAAGTPWGGGVMRSIDTLPAALQVDDSGSIVKTVGGKFWIREELLTGLGEIRVEWYLQSAPAFNYDASDVVQRAADTAALWARYSSKNKTVRLVMPAKLYITKTVTVLHRGVRIDGNNGAVLFDSGGTYTAYSSLSTNSYITTTPDTGQTVRACLNLTHGSGGPGHPNPAYFGQCLIKDWDIILGTPSGGDSYTIAPLSDNGLVAICHWGTSTVAAAQGYFENLTFHGYGVGYINGNNTWGYDFYECKWVGCWIPVWLINGADNSERYTLYGCVVQNGYRCVYSPWGGDFNIVKGSYVWNTGPYFEFPTAGNMIEINPSRIEMVNTSQPLLKVATSIETGATSQTFPLVKLHGSMILLDASTVQPENYLFSVSKYSKLIVEDNTWSNKNMTTLANLKLLNPADTGGKVLFRNNTMRVGIFSEFARDNRLLTSTTPAGRLDTITLGGANAANATVSTSGANLTLTVNITATGAMTLLLKVPVDIDMTDWDSFSWKAVFNNISLTGTWSVNAFVNVDGSSYINNRLDLGSVSLNSVADITDVSSNNSYGYRRIQKRADGGWERVPTAFYLYFSSTSQVAGDTFTINRLGLLGY
jgi:hypothetical protein